MEIKVRVKVADKDMGNYLGSASVTIDESFIITDFRIMNSEKGIFVANPSRKGANGDYKEICFPITREFREKLYGVILEEYYRLTRNFGGNKKEEVTTQSNPFANKTMPQPQMMESDDLPF